MKFKSIVLLLMMIFSVLMIPSCVSAHEIPSVTSESISGSLNSEMTLQYITQVQSPTNTTGTMTMIRIQIPGIAVYTSGYSLS